MTASTWTIGAITATACAFISIADFARASFVLHNSAEVGVPRTWLPALASLKTAGALGVLVGLLWWPVIGIAAAGGLTLFFIGAIAAHVRAGVYHNIAFPGAFLAFSMTTLALMINS